MAYQRQTPGDKGISLFGGINVGGGVDIKGFKTGTFTADTSSIPLSSVKTTTFTVTGGTTGDLVLVFASTALNAGLTLMGTAQVTATSQATINFVNETTAAIVQTSGLTNKYLLIDIT